MIPKIFKPKDFQYGISHDKAQSIFEAWLAQHGKVVYGSIPPGEDSIYWSEQQISEDTHQALLICVQEIEKNECEHKYVKISGLVRDKDGVNEAWKSVCNDCGKDLKANWTVIE